MPELPEVETVVRLLNQQLSGSTVHHVEWRVASLLKGDKQQFASLFHHQTITRVTRQAKYILIHFQHGYTLVSHLRMEGKYREILDPTIPPSPYAHVLIYLTDGRRIDYQDVRKFGTFEWAKTDELYRLKSLSKLGPEPFDIQQSDDFYKRIAPSNRSIKSLLLDQTILSGLGNIYVDETLFAACLHPSTLGKNVSKPMANVIIKESQRILKEAIESGGSRIRSYSSGQPIDGQFTLKIKVYQKDGSPCPRCQHRIARTVVAGRGTHYCPRCQHDPRLPFVVGITGSMASGKSTFLQRANEKGYAVLSADNVVHSLYQKTSIQRQLSQLVDRSIIKNKRVQGEVLLSWMLNDSRNLKKLETWLHPLVLKVIVQWLRQQKTLAFVEIPLLFQRDADQWMDYTLAIDRPFEERKQTIQLRHPNQSIEPYIVLDEKNKWKHYRSFLNSIIDNRSSMEKFEQDIEAELNKIIVASQVK
jgi:formamidopyrimidine-DNA glycosylase